MTPLTYLGVLEFNGSDAKLFLHNQLSASIETLDTGESTFACYCHPNGRVIALLLVGRLETGYQVICPKELMDSLLPRLRMFVLRDDVQIEVRDDLYVCGQTDTTAENGGFTPVPGFSYLTQSSTPLDDTNSDAFIAAELAAGICWLSTTTTQQYLPQMLGYQRIGALDFRKGCFPGQEIVARTKYLGKLKRRPCLAYSENLPAVDASRKVSLVSTDQEITAELVQSVKDDSGGYMSLLIARTRDPFDGDRLKTPENEIGVRLEWPELDD